MGTYLTRVGVALDVLLNVIFLNGAAGQTISLHAAIAQARGARWGCILCRWLSLTVEHDHCRRQLQGRPDHPAATVRAGIQLVIAFVILWGSAHLTAGMF